MFGILLGLFVLFIIGIAISARGESDTKPKIAQLAAAIAEVKRALPGLEGSQAADLAQSHLDQALACYSELAQMAARGHWDSGYKKAEEGLVHIELAARLAGIEVNALKVEGKDKEELSGK